VFFSNSRPIDEVKLTTIGIVSVLGNLRSVDYRYKLLWSNLVKIAIDFFEKKGLSNYLNKRETYLDSDYSISIAPAANYDTDLENFWTQSGKFYFIYFKK